MAEGSIGEQGFLVAGKSVCSPMRSWGVFRLDELSVVVPGKVRVPPAVVMVELDWELCKDAAVELVNEVSQLTCRAGWQATYRLLKGVAIVDRAAAALPYVAAVPVPAPRSVGSGFAVPVLESAEDFTGEGLSEFYGCVGRTRKASVLGGLPTERGRSVLAELACGVLPHLNRAPTRHVPSCWSWRRS